jgi:hypothetical protein
MSSLYHRRLSDKKKIKLARIINYCGVCESIFMEVVKMADKGFYIFYIEIYTVAKSDRFSIFRLLHPINPLVVDTEHWKELASQKFCPVFLILTNYWLELTYSNRFSPCYP